MKSVGYLLNQIRILLHRGRFHRDLDEEMAFHRELKEKQFVEDGMAPAAARHAVNREFGNTTHSREQSHEVVAFRFESIWQDIRFAIRQLIKNPSFACTGILVLVLGLSACTAIFAFVDAALLKPLPFPNPNRLVSVMERGPSYPRSNLSYPDYLDWKRLNHAFRSLDVYARTGFLLRTATGTEMVPAMRVSDGFFHTLGVAPLLGRDFYPGEDSPNAANTVILTYGSWQNRYGGRNDVVGQTILLNGTPTTIVGVLPNEFQFAIAGRSEFWVPLRVSGIYAACEQNRACHNLDGVARLKDGASVASAEAEMKTIAAQLEKQYPGSNRQQGASVILLSEEIVGSIRPILFLLLGGAALLLLIACVNVASLLLVRSENRKREIAVRNALGASQRRLIGQFIIEGLVLALTGGIFGLLATYGLIQVLLRLVSPSMMARMPYLAGLGINSHLLFFELAIVLLAAVLFAITPFLRLSLREIREGLTSGNRGSAGTVWARLGSNLVALELAIAMVLLSGAGLLGESFYRLLHVDLKFQPDHLATLEIAVPPTGYEEKGQLGRLAERISERIQELPGVQSASVTSLLPVSRNGNTDWIRFVGKPYNGEHNEVNLRDISPGYFATLKARLLRGRVFTNADDESHPKVVIINQALARKYFPGEDPIGKKIGDGALTPSSIKEIVGIVDDIQEASLNADTWPAVYYPFAQDTDSYFNLVVRTSGRENALMPSIIAALHQLAPEIGVTGGLSLEERMRDSQTAYLHRSSAWLVGGFAVLALLLSVIGLYGVISYSVSQRTREIGVRMALGAQRSSVYSLVLKQAGWLIFFGVTIGLAGSFATANVIRNLYFGISSWEGLLMIAVASALTVFALLASYLPARRAASVNPVEALRAE